MRRNVSIILGNTFLAGLVAFSSQALAGPPLICHPFEIEGAKSLPWAGGTGFNTPDPAYDTGRLAEDTLKLLRSETPVIVRMETLRRAALYGVKDQRAEFELLARLTARAAGAEAGGKQDTAALFDAGYLIETLKQAAWLYKRNLAEGLDGTALVLGAASHGMDAASVEFAASLMEHGPWPNSHFRRAVAGAEEGSLLARNLVHYSEKGRTFAELRAQYARN